MEVTLTTECIPWKDRKKELYLEYIKLTLTEWRERTKQKIDKFLNCA